MVWAEHDTTTATRSRISFRIDCLNYLICFGLSRTLACLPEDRLFSALFASRCFETG
jgi:hypothetical protein